MSSLIATATTALCGILSLCAEPATDTPGATKQGATKQGATHHEQPSIASAPPYAFPLGSASKIFSYRADILLAPIERYLDQTASSPWWNAAYFGMTPEQLTAQEQSWESPFLSAYHQYMSAGGDNGIAITFKMATGHSACLLQTDIIDRLGELVSTPAIDASQIDQATLAWHEYGHCVYHAARPDVAISHHMSDATRYEIELFADAYSMSQLWRLHRYDITERLIKKRDRALTYANDHTHWTSPALPTWQMYLAGPSNADSSDADVQATLLHWVTSNDWLAIRDAHQGK